MLIISQNVKNYGLPFPDETIFRINLAWINTIKELRTLLEKNRNNDIFLDLPVARIKPPNNKYSVSQIIPILESYPNIKYFAVSNIESKEDLSEYVEKIPSRIVIVPKIESPKGIDNIDEISKGLKTNKKIFMLDHDDLYSQIIKQKMDSSKFIFYIEKVKNYCEKNNITLLRTVGVIFSDEEKRITEYVK